MPLVSVIVPAYNAEETLEKTVRDLLDQTYSDMEIILVDDGSRDKTPELCDALAREDSRIRVLHQKNGGLSNARNNGTKIAQGQYVSYVDSDDRIDDHYLEYLVRALQDTGAHLACAQMDRTREGQDVFDPVGDYNVRKLGTKEALIQMGTIGISVGSCCKLSLREYYLKHPFLEGKLHEDLSNTYKIIMENDAIANMDAALYHYMMRSGSITGRKQTTVKQCIDYYEAINACSAGVLRAYPDIEDSMAVLKAKDYMALYLVIHRCNEKDAKLEEMEREVLSWMKRHWKTAFSNRQAPTELRMRFLLFGISPRLYKHLYYVGIRFKGKGIS